MEIIMECTVITFFIVCPLVFLASLVDSIAGGGGLISLPAYLFAGLPAHQAIATNKLSSATGTFISTARLVKNKYADMRLAFPSIIAAFIGSTIGANIALRTSDKVLKVVLLAVLPIVAFYVLKKKDLEPVSDVKVSRKMQYIIVTAASLIIGMYDGFYGPGTGTFLLLAFTGLAGLDVRTASGNMKLVNLTSNIAALVTFLFAGKIVWALGLAAAVFSVAGHYIGSGLVMKSGTRIVRPIIVVVVVILFVKILTGF